MATTVTKVGGTPSQPAYVSVDTDGTLEVSDGTTTNTLTSAILAALTKFSGYVWDASAAATGEAYVSLGSNLASALAFRQSSTALLDFVTTTNKVFVKLGGRLKLGSSTSVSMGGAAHALVLGTAGSNQTQLVGNTVTVTAGGAGLTLTLPTASDCGELVLIIMNISTDTFTVGGALTASVAQGKAAIAYCNGTQWASYAIG